MAIRGIRGASKTSRKQSATVGYSGVGAKGDNVLRECMLLCFHVVSMENEIVAANCD